jgi:hypothetical protein
MLISALPATGKATGSLSTGAPAGIVTEPRPPKVTFRIEAGSTLEAPLGLATVTAPASNGSDPYSFERRMRIRSPPTDTRTRSRTVWLSILSSGSSGSGAADCGLDVHVATQALGVAAGSEGTVSRNKTESRFFSLSIGYCNAE